MLHSKISIQVSISEMQVGGLLSVCILELV